MVHSAGNSENLSCIGSRILLIRLYFGSPHRNRIALPRSH